ncbi:hypothetical protein EJF90_02270 [Neisseria meningitidis]|nr:hypothetical protein [Neisseria meningitidis]
MRFKALRVPHCRPFKHGVYLTGAQSALSFTEQAVWIPACVGMTGFEIAAFIGKNRNRSAVIPAQAGIQTLEQQQYSKII